jgi:hypothetical protein
MSEQLLIWIMGICVMLCAAAMIAQAVAGFRILRIVRPFFQKRRQLTDEAKHLLEMTGAMVREAQPRLLATSDKARELAKMTSGRASDWKRGVEEIAEPFSRLGGSSKAKPRRIHTPVGPVVAPTEHKIKEDY